MLRRSAPTRPRAEQPAPGGLFPVLAHRRPFQIPPSIQKSAGRAFARPADLAEKVGFRTQLRRRDGRLPFSRASACASSGGRFAPLCLLATPLPPNPKGHLAMPLLVWRRVWDSNPRGIAPKRFSRPPRYDHFDNSPYLVYEKTPCGDRARPVRVVGLIANIICAHPFRALRGISSRKQPTGLFSLVHPL